MQYSCFSGFALFICFSVLFCLFVRFFFCLVLCNLYSTLSGSYREGVASRWHWELNLHLIFINKSSWKITLYVPKKWNQRRRHSQPYTTFPLFHCYTRITQYFLFKCALSEIFPEVCIIFFMLTGRKKSTFLGTTFFFYFFSILKQSLYHFPSAQVNRGTIQTTASQGT